MSGSGVKSVFGTMSVLCTNVRSRYQYWYRFICFISLRGSWAVCIRDCFDVGIPLRTFCLVTRPIRASLSLPLNPFCRALSRLRPDWAVYLNWSTCSLTYLCNVLPAHLIYPIQRKPTFYFIYLLYLILDHAISSYVFIIFLFYLLLYPMNCTLNNAMWF